MTVLRQLLSHLSAQTQRIHTPKHVGGSWREQEGKINAPVLCIRSLIEASHTPPWPNRTCNEQELKKAYRRQMNQHHPDKLVAKGLPDEMIEIATQKTQDIKAAYEIIKTERG